MDNWKKQFSQEGRYFETNKGILYNGDVLSILKILPDESINCVVTSPPYFNKIDYKVEGQIGIEKTIDEYLNKLWNVFDEIKRILKDTGVCFVNIGDTYNNNSNGGPLASPKSKLMNGKGRNPKTKFNVTVKKKRQPYPLKTLLLVPERFAIGMVERKWVLRNVIIWYRPNAIPESVKDRFTKDFEYIYFFTKKPKYYFKQQFEESRMDNERKRNRRTVWSINTQKLKELHFAPFPTKIPEICINAGCPDDGIVLDPFMGSGTTQIVQEKLNRKWIGIELNKEFCNLFRQRIERETKQMTLGV